MRQEMIELALGRGAVESAQSGTFPTAAVSALRRLLEELRPLVGDLATRALYVRSLHLARSGFQRPDPTDSTHRSTLEALLAPLETDLASRAPADAAEAGRALLHALVDLLISLIGEHLTHRMLRTAWGIPTAGLPSEEKPQ